MGRMQRQKGKAGEREAAAAWTAAFGVFARRGRQYSGSDDSPDIVTGHGWLHLEVKRTESGNPYRWLEQAIEDAGDKIPVVLHRRNREEWIVVMRLKDAPDFAREVSRE